MRILIQGLGCTETGARIVFRELLSSLPPGVRCVAICTTETAHMLIRKPRGRFSERVWLLGLSHCFFGRWLRLPLEVFIALLGATRVFGRVVNLSHYGLCWGGAYTLYVHNLLLMDLTQPQGWNQGRPNALNRWMLDTCINRARLLVLQTQTTCEQLKRYCAARGLAVPAHRVMRPAVKVDIETKATRCFDFQLFYPTSRWPHKRQELAIAGSKLAAEKVSGLGLVITVPYEPGDPSEAIMCVGQLVRVDVDAFYAGSDALLFVSEIESLGLPLLEALAAGLPVIAPRLPYAVEILGEAGCYFEGNAPESVAAAIEECHGNLDAWRAKIKARAEVVRQDAATWAEHWGVFLGATRGEPSSVE